jgi:ABC-type uncharacterized transport system involved in gliding motility auxiliary subunit
MPTAWGPEMKVTAKLHRQLQFATATFVFLVLCVAGLLLWLSHLYHFDADLTRNGRNSLSPASVAVLKRLDKPVRIDAFVSAGNPLHDAIQKLVQAYQRVKPNIKLEFVDPNANPDRVRKAGVRVVGALQIQYDNKSEVVEDPREETITNALNRLGRRGEQWLVFLTGHGERSPDGEANFDLSKWAAYLKRQGFQIHSLSLAENPQIPQNTSVLVIAGPQTRLLPAEVKTIQSYVRKGGNLLWLADPGPSHGLSPLAEQLGFEFDPGVIVDPVSQLLTRSARALVIASYHNQPALKGFHQETVFPDACGISLNRDQQVDSKAKHDGTSNSWNPAVLVDTRPSAWSETGPLNQTIAYNKGKDIPGPLDVGVAFTRQHGKDQQRAVVMCDGDFAANSFVLGNGGNLDFAMRLVNWVSANDNFIDVPTRTAVDSHLVLSPAMDLVLRLVFVLLLPLGLLTSGLLIWMRRRRR